MSARWMATALLFALTFGPGAKALGRDLDAVAPKAKCEELQGRVFQAGDDPARITSAKANLENAAAPFCEVAGYVAPQVRFGMKLPLNSWRQRLLFLGCGGFCGGVGTRAWAVARCGAYDRGEFAVVYSDLGHTALHSDGLWAHGNPQGIRDFGSRGVHVANLAAQWIIAEFYGQAAKYRYFSGCSDGGREALMAARRYPGDFDGIVAGAPAANLTMNNSVYHAWFAQHLLSPDKKLLVDEAQLAAVGAETMRQCDGLDGKVDSVIADPTHCRPKLDRLDCAAANVPGCLGAQQIAAVQAIYAGPRDAKGRGLYYGVAPGSEYSWARQVLGSVDFAMNFTSFMTGQRPAAVQDVWKIGYSPAWLKRFNHHAAELNALNPDLSAFRAGGGKLLVWHGAADSSIPAGSTIDYVLAVRKRLGAGTADSFLRFFLVPGMAHCTAVAPGPTEVNFLDPLMQWVEDGTPPGAVPAWGAPGSPDWSLRPYFER